MDPISKALAERLDDKRLSSQAKKAILTGQSQKRKSFMPQIVVLCMCAIAAFLIFTNVGSEKSILHTASQEARFGDLDKAILQYVNDEAAQLQIIVEERNRTFFNGDAYLMRLALEQNSGVFYQDSSLNEHDRFLISELLHTIQEASWQANVTTRIKPVQSIEELVAEAPSIIAKLKPYVEMTYVKIADEQRLGLKLYSFDTKNWITYFAILAVLVLFIIKLLKNNYRIIGALVIIATFVSFMQPFVLPFKGSVAYDEQTMLEVVQKMLEEQNVKTVGQPVLEYAASINQTRTALVSFEDGLSVLATFQYRDGQYVQNTMMWHSGAIFHESAFNGLDDELMLVRVHGFKTGHEVGTIQIKDDENRIEEVKLTQKKPTIIYYKKSADTSELKYHLFNEQGEELYTGS